MQQPTTTNRKPRRAGVSEAHRPNLNPTSVAAPFPEREPSGEKPGALALCVSCKRCRQLDIQLREAQAELSELRLWRDTHQQVTQQEREELGALRLAMGKHL